MNAQVIDNFEIKGRVALEYGTAGLVVIYAPFDSADLPLAGETVFIVRQDGWMRAAIIGEVKPNPGAPGFVIPGVTKDDVPVGTRLRWGKDLSSVMPHSTPASAG